MSNQENSPDLPQLNMIGDLIRSRRTINFFRPDRVPDSIIRDAIDVARWAPNHKQTEPWHFHLLGEKTISIVKSLITELKSAGQSDTVRTGVMKRLDGIPGWLVVSCKVSEDAVTQMEDYAACSCAIQNMMLYLWSAGIGMKWTTGKVIRDERFARLFESGTGELIMGLFWYGYPVGIPIQNRRTVSEITTLLD